MSHVTNESSEPAKGTMPDFSGYWRQVKNENFDNYLKALGYTWVLRKTAVKFGSDSTDLIKQKGAVLKVTTVNAKGSWTRKLVVGKEVRQRTAEGLIGKTTAWWDGKVHKSRIVCRTGAFESWRYIESGLMAVKSIFTPEKGREAHMYWYFEAFTPHSRQVSGAGGAATARAVTRDARRVGRATARDNAYLQQVVRQLPKWDTPADSYISASGSSPRRDWGPKDGYPTSTPYSASPLSASPQSSINPGQLNTALGPHMRSRPDSSASLAQDGEAEEVGNSAPSAEQANSGTLKSDGTLEEDRDAMSTDANADSASARAEARASGEQHAPPERGHLKSHLSGDSLSALSGKDAENKSMASGARGRGGALTPEALLSFKIQEYADTRSITSVVPVDNPLNTEEPELLEMSPEQVEETQLKLIELEYEISKEQLFRQKYAQGFNCCCCTWVWHCVSIPDYIRSWDL